MAKRLLLVASLEERMSAVEQMGSAKRAQPAGKVVATFSVPECSSGLRVTVIEDAGVVRIFPEATIPLVKGLARLVCGVYDGERIKDIAGFETRILQRAEVWDAVSPVRQAGIEGLMRQLRITFESMEKSKGMRLQALTVSVHCGDALRVCAGNREYFDRWTVVTVAEDTVTQGVCAEFGMECIISKQPPLETETALGMSHAGEYINEGLDALAHCEWVLLLEPNVLLPSEFRRRIESLALAEDTLYSPRDLRKCRAERAKMLAQFFDWSVPRSASRNAWAMVRLFHRPSISERFPDSTTNSVWQNHDAQFHSMFPVKCREVLPFGALVVEGTATADSEAGWLPLDGFAGTGAVVGIPLAERAIALATRMEKVSVFPVRETANERANKVADEVTIRQIFCEQTKGCANLSFAECDPSDAIEDGSLDVLYLAGDLTLSWLCRSLPFWLPKLREGGWICGDFYGLPAWPEVTHALAVLLGTPHGRSNDGAWWKRFYHAERPLPLAKADGRSPVVFRIENIWETEALVLSLSAARKHWSGEIRVIQRGQDNEAVMLACAKYGAVYVRSKEEEQVKELALSPGCVAVAPLAPLVSKHAAVRTPKLRTSDAFVADEVTVPPAGSELAVRAQEFDGNGALVYFAGSAEEWSDAAWGTWCELEVEAARLNANEVALAENATIACVITEQDAGDFQRNWLSWRFPPGTPILLIFADVNPSEFWLPDLEKARVISIASEQATVPKLLRIIAESCETERVILLSPLVAALPGAELWRDLPDDFDAFHLPEFAKREEAISGNRFILNAYFAALSKNELFACEEDSQTLSSWLLDWAENKQAMRENITISDLAELGWSFPNVYAWSSDGEPLNQSATEITHTRPDGLLQLADDVVVITLPGRMDRQERVTEMMAAERVWFRFVDGVRVTDEEIEPFEIAEVGRQNFKMVAGFEKYLRGMVGCRRAHLRELEAAKAAGLKSLMIIEDDCVLESGWREKLDGALAELPNGWLQLHFSAGDFRPSHVISKHLRRLGGAHQTTAILYSEAGIAAALNCIRHSRSEIDHWMGQHLHPFGNSYVVEPRIATQQGGMSDIMGFDRGVTA